LSLSLSFSLCVTQKWKRRVNNHRSVTFWLSVFPTKEWLWRILRSHCPPRCPCKMRRHECPDNTVTVLQYMLYLSYKVFHNGYYSKLLSHLQFFLSVSLFLFLTQSPRLRNVCLASLRSFPGEWRRVK
jgi:hypothetical protein